MPGLVKGSRAQVWHGNADVTAGGLRKSQLVKGKDGRIKSKKMVQRGKELRKESIKNGTLARPFTAADGGRKRKRSRSRSRSRPRSRSVKRRRR